MNRAASLVLTILVLTILVFCPAYLTAQPATKLVPMDGEPLDHFGASVSVSGNTLVVGANLHDGQGNNAGAAYIYQQEGARWVLVEKIIAADGENEDGFGTSVMIDGDFAVIGALGDDDNGSNAGAAYVFRREGAAWSQHSKLTANDGVPNDGFGFAVALKGNYALIGARGADENGNGSGAAYLFGYSGVGWEQLNKLLPADGTSGDAFGTAVAITETFAVVGAVLADGLEEGAGAAYTFENRGAIWQERDKLKASDGARLDQFGSSVSISGDYIVVGAKANDDIGIDAGAAYVFQQQDNGFVEVDKLVARAGASNDFFGQAASVLVTNDYGTYAAIGAPGDDDQGAGAGAVYLFKQQDGHWREVSKLIPDANLIDAGFGIGVSAGEGQALAGAWRDVAAGDSTGAAYVFDLTTVLTHLDTREAPSAVSQEIIQEVYPNPFLDAATITYRLAAQARVKVSVFDLMGRAVQVLHFGTQSAGLYEANWDGRGVLGLDQPAGVYFVIIETNEAFDRAPMLKVR